MNYRDDNVAAQWHAFLMHPIVRRWQADVSAGTYLCRKTLHELLVGCWAYQQSPRIWDLMRTQPQTDAVDRQALQILAASPYQVWYDRWQPIVAEWATQLAVLAEQYGSVDDKTDNESALDAPRVISQIAAITDAVIVMMAEVRALPEPGEARVQDFIDWMLAGARRIYEIHDAMRDLDYLRIWIYPDTLTDLF